AMLLGSVLPEYRLLIADGLLGGAPPLFDVSPGAMSFDALERSFERPRPGLPYRPPAEYGARLRGAIVKYHAEADRAVAMLGCRVHVIPNGVPVDAAARRPPGSRLGIGTAGRIHPHKRVGEFVGALRRSRASLA